MRNDRSSILAADHLYFGWRLVAALALTATLLFGVSLYGFVIISTPLAQDFSWSNSQMGALVSGMWIAAPLALFGGPLIERIGPWRVIFMSIALVSVAMALLAVISEFWQLYLLRVLTGFGKVAAVTAFPIILGRWFSRRFATAMAIVWAAASAGGIFLSPVAEAINMAVGWRMTSLALALILSLAIPLSLLLRAGAPSKGAGLQQAEELSGDSLESRPDGPALDWRQLRTSRGGGQLLVILPAVAATGMAAIGILAMLPAIALASGLPQAATATLLSLTAAASMTGSMTLGWILDHLRSMGVAILIIALAVCVGVAGLAAMTVSGNILFGVGGAVGAGYAMGSIDLLWMMMIRRRFGVAAYGLLYGFWYFSLQVGYVFGGGVSGSIFDAFGAMPFLLFIGALYLPSIAFGCFAARALRR